MVIIITITVHASYELMITEFGCLPLLVVGETGH